MKNIIWDVKVFDIDRIDPKTAKTNREAEEQQMSSDSTLKRRRFTRRFGQRLTSAEGDRITH